MNRRTYLVGLASTAALAGCTGSGPPTAGRSETTGETTGRSETTSHSETVVQYRDLSDEGKNVFEALLETDSLVGPKSDFPTDIWTADYVEYEGTVYAIERDQTGDYIAEYSVHTEFVNETAIEDDAAVIAFEELTPTAQDIFEASRFGEQQESVGDPSSHFGQYDYVRYEGDYYRVATVVGDIPEWELSAMKTDR
ncbi:hypothetical protein [Haloferax sp. DFSO52]|uniref:hypothetical protein n=1 Tax=Haloferax sp. DFSO52 TaxID=3388505 RepID=UPI003A8AADBF